MNVYSKSYLRQVVETQGELFDMFARRYPNSDTDDFIASYMRGRTRAAIDAGQAYVCTMSADGLLERFLSEDGYLPKQGIAMSGFMPDWIGRFYAYFQWAKEVSSAEALVAVPLAYLKSAYPGLHDLELDLAVAKVA